jgi:hypothetical protein
MRQQFIGSDGGGEHSHHQDPEPTHAVLPQSFDQGVQQVRAVAFPGSVACRVTSSTSAPRNGQGRTLDVREELAVGGDASDRRRQAEGRGGGQVSDRDRVWFHRRARSLGSLAERTGKRRGLRARPPSAPQASASIASPCTTMVVSPPRARQGLRFNADRRPIDRAPPRQALVPPADLGDYREMVGVYFRPYAELGHSQLAAREDVINR